MFADTGIYLATDRKAREVKALLCYENFPQYYRGLATLCAVLSPVERLRQERPFDYSRIRVQTVRELLAQRSNAGEVCMMQSYAALADGANMVCGLADQATGHFTSAVYFD